ncbi:MAG: virulence RhuM family protein [Thermoleophilia bacterium]
MSLDKLETENEIILYQSPEGDVQVDVLLEQETVWLSLIQIAELFERDKSVISRHFRNIFSSGELERDLVVAKNATTAADGKTYQVEYFNLDAILSVGYRINSRRGTQFRIWATHTLRDHLLRGYTLHEKRLRERGLSEIEQAMALLSRTLTRNELVSGEGRAAIEIVEQYTRAWKLLLQYDEDRLSEAPERPLKPAAALPLVDANAAIIDLRTALFSRGEATDIFGQERADHLGAILGAVNRRSVAIRYIPQCRPEPRICCTSSSRTIHLLTATNASVRCCSWSICDETACS